MPSDNIQYAVSRVKILESTLLDAGRLARLRELPLAEAVKQLSDWGYAAEYPVKTDVEGMIEFRRRELRAIVDDVTPDKPLTDLFYLETDATNLKLLLKYRMLGTEGLDYQTLPEGNFPVALIRDCVTAGDYAPLGGVLAERLNAAEAQLRLEVNPRKLSAAVDDAFFAHIFEVLKSRRDSFCTSWFKRRAGFVNLLSVLRARALRWDKADFAPMLVHGSDIADDLLLEAVEAPQERLAELLAIRGRTDLVELDGSDAAVVRAAIETDRAGSPEDTRTLLDDALLDMARERRNDSFGIGPIVYFLLRAQREARNLRVMFAKKRAGAAKAAAQ